MHKFIVSCYYWPTAEGRLRLRTLRVKANRRNAETKLEIPRLGSLGIANDAPAPGERRAAPRFTSICDAKLKASLSILDFDAEPTPESLVFLGRTKDLSANGLALVLPSAIIDERYCSNAQSLQLFLHLPSRMVALEVNAVRCEPLIADGSTLGYLIGAQIVSIDDQRDEYDSYLRTILDVSADG